MRKMAKMSDTAVSAFSPPDSRFMFWRRLPGGCAMMSTPVSSRFSGSVSSSRARPPRKSCGKMRWNSASTTLKVSSKSSRDILSIFLMADSRSPMAFSRSAFWSARKVCR